MTMTARAMRASTSSGLPRLQRKCGSCSHGHASPGGRRCQACEEAAGAERLPVAAQDVTAPAGRPASHAAFTIGAPGDAFEREADRTAEQVMAGAAASVTPGAGARLQRLATAAPNLAHAPAEVQQVLANPGRPLDPGARGFFEPRFGRDFSSVRVHADDAADRSARAVGAQAYTVGHHIVFARGTYAPAADPGRRLLAHELAHVLQQSRRSGHTPSVQRRGKGPGSCGWLDEAAANVLGGEAHFQIQTALSARGLASELPIPRASKKDNLGSRKCQPDGSSFGYADLARITPPAVGISEIKPWWRARSGIARLEAMHYRLRANQSKQRLTGTGPCGMRPAGLDDQGFSAAVGPISAASSFDLLKGAITGIEDFGPFATDPHKNLRAQETSAGAIGYWCVLNEEGKKKKQEDDDKKKKEKEEKKKKKEEDRNKKKRERDEKKKNKQEKAEKERMEKEKAKKEKADEKKAKKEKAEKPKASASAGNLGFGISIFGSSTGGANAGVGISVGSNSAAVGTAGASVSWFSDSATAGAAGVSASADSMGATAAAAGASASKDSESLTLGAAGVSSSEGSSAASAGVAGAAESKDSLSATAGAAGRSETEGSTIAGAGGSGSGKVSGVAGAGTGSPKKTVDPADVTGSGVDKVPEGQSDGEIMAGQGSKDGKPGDAGEAQASDEPAGRSDVTGQGAGQGAGEGDKSGAGERKTRPGPGGSTNTQPQPGSPGGGGDPGTTGGASDPGKAGGQGSPGPAGSAADPGKAGASGTGTAGAGATTAEPGTGTGPGPGTGPGTGKGTGTKGSTATGGSAVGLGVLPVFPRQSSNEAREKIGKEAGQVSKMLANAQPAQKLLLEYLASKDPTGQYIVPTSVWVDKLLKATDGLKPEDIEFLKTLDWKPGSVSAAELRKRVLEALKNKGKPKGNADKPGGKKAGGKNGGAAAGSQGGGEKGPGKGDKGGETPPKQDESPFVAAGGFTSARPFTGDRSSIKERFYRFVVSDASITAATKKGDQVPLTMTWIGDDGKAYYHRLTYEVVGEPVPQTDPQFKGRKLLRFDLKTGNTEVIDVAPEGQRPFLLTPGRPASFRIFSD